MNFKINFYYILYNIRSNILFYFFLFKDKHKHYFNLKYVINFEIQFAVIAIMFLLFDIEVLYLFPLVSSLYNIMTLDILIILGFYVLLIGLLYEISRKILDFQTSITSIIKPTWNIFKPVNPFIVVIGLQKEGKMEESIALLKQVNDFVFECLSKGLYFSEIQIQGSSLHNWELTSKAICAMANTIIKQTSIENINLAQNLIEKFISLNDLSDYIFKLPKIIKQSVDIALPDIAEKIRISNIGELMLNPPGPVIREYNGILYEIGYFCTEHWLLCLFGILIIAGTVYYIYPNNKIVSSIEIKNTKPSKIPAEESLTSIHEDLYDINHIIYDNILYIITIIVIILVYLVVSIPFLHSFYLTIISKITFLLQTIYQYILLLACFLLISLCLFFLPNIFVMLKIIILISILYFLIYINLDIPLSKISFLAFFVNNIILLFILFGIYNVYFIIDKPIYISDLSLWSKYKYIFLCIFVFFGSIVYSVSLFKPKITSWMSSLSYPYLKEEIRKILYCWNDNFMGDFCIYLYKNISKSPLFSFFYFFFHYIIFYLFRICMLYYFIKFAFFYGDFRPLIYCIPLSFFVWILSFIDYYFKIFREGTKNSLLEIINVKLNNINVIKKKEFITCNDTDLIFTLTPVAFENGFTQQDIIFFKQKWYDTVSITYKYDYYETLIKISNSIILFLFIICLFSIGYTIIDYEFLTGPFFTFIRRTPFQKSFILRYPHEMWYVREGQPKIQDIVVEILKK